MLLGPHPKVIEFECPQADLGFVGLECSPDVSRVRGRVSHRSGPPRALISSAPFHPELPAPPHAISLHSTSFHCDPFCLETFHGDWLTDAVTYKVFMEGHLYTLCWSKKGRQQQPAGQRSSSPGFRRGRRGHKPIDRNVYRWRLEQ